MNGAINQRILRGFLQGLLSSELPWKELERFAASLSDADTVRTLQEATYGLVDTLRKVGAPKPPPSPPSGAGEQTLLDFLQRKRLSKMQVRERMYSIAPDLPLGGSNDHKTMRDLVQIFSLNYPHKVSELISAFGGQDQGDDYLKGIIGRDKG
jgi:hypothetical protein